MIGMLMCVRARYLRKGDTVIGHNIKNVVEFVAVGYDGMCRIDFENGRKSFCDNNDILQIIRGEK